MVTNKSNYGKKGITIKQIEEALRASGGIIVHAAEMLGCSHVNICKRIAKSEKLKTAMKDYEQSFVKLAESQIVKGMLDGDKGSCMFYLKCKGGYSEKQKVESDVKLSYEQLLDVIKALKSK